jgi:hypothetical protein
LVGDVALDEARAPDSRGRIGVFGRGDSGDTERKEQQGQESDKDGRHGDLRRAQCALHDPETAPAKRR